MILDRLTDAAAKYIKVCPLPRQDVLDAIAEIETLGAALHDLVRQIEIGAPRDEHGHDLRRNDAYLLAVALLKRE